MGSAETARFRRQHPRNAQLGARPPSWPLQHTSSRDLAHTIRTGRTRSTRPQHGPYHSRCRSVTPMPSAHFTYLGPWGGAPRP